MADQSLLTPDRAATLLNVTAGTPDLVIGVDPEQRLAWMHGAYWYQGEYLYAPHPDFLIGLWQRRTLRDQQEQLNRYVESLAERV